VATFIFDKLGELYAALERAYRLGVSLPDAPLEQFRVATQNMTQTTEAECLAVRRVGQTLFRQALLEYWNGRCPLTGITDLALLRASHIVAWADCETDALRLDVHNGLLLSALWDAAFDAGLLSFADNGAVLRSPNLTPSAAEALDVDAVNSISGLTDAHRANLVRHRLKYCF
jgi:predicted restriction endonuclease